MPRAEGRAVLLPFYLPIIIKVFLLHLKIWYLRMLFKSQILGRNLNDRELGTRKSEDGLCIGSEDLR